MQGDFTSVSAADLLVDLLRRRFTGTLRVDRAGTVKVLYLSQGDFACASSNAEEDKLGNLLVQMGHLTPEQLEHAKAKQTERASIGNTLVELGYITAAELLNGARRQVEEIVADLLGWREGAYQTRPMPLSREVVNLGMPGRAVVVRALQHLSDRELVVERLGGLETVLSRVEPFDEAARSLDVGFQAEPILSALDGRRSVREICELLDLEDFKVCKTLHILLCFGLVKRTSVAAPRALVFVEGELQNGEVMPRAGDLASRRARRAAARPSTSGPGPHLAPVPLPAASPPERVGETEVHVDAPAAQADLATADLASADLASADPATPGTLPYLEPAAQPDSGGLRRLGVRAVVALGLAAVLGGIVYFTYIRPTTGPSEEEEARLLAALLEETQGVEEPAAPVAPSPRPTAVKPRIAIEPRPTAAPSAAPPPAAADTPPLAKTALSTMLSSDANFRSALELVGERRFREAADSFRRALENQAAGAYSIQILLACQDATLENSFARAAGRTLYAVPTTFRGQSCYRLFDGLYGSDEEARRELEKLPALFFEDGNRPVVVRAPQP